MGDAVAEGALGLFLTTRGSKAHGQAKEGVEGTELAGTIADQPGFVGNLYAAVSRAPEAIIDYDLNTGRGTMNPLYAQVGSAVVENELFNMFSGDDKKGDVDAVDFAVEGQAAIDSQPEVFDETLPVTQSANNRNIGNKIHQEYQRVQGIKQPDSLPEREAETLGASFKAMWQAQNPTLATVHNDPETGNNYYQLTPDGDAAMRKGQTERKVLFPKVNVKPNKQPNNCLLYTSPSPRDS